ncbi:MAG TPA: DUF2480 family protein [Cyclobacteriaceae bacterium]|nr:DUF2480 family protein [Cyclobacteriaceae bacterium]
MENQEITNRVAQSSLISFDLEELHQPGDRVLLDIREQLYEGLILKEKDFRAFIRDYSWESYKNKFVAINCSTDAVIPTWAFMLLAVALKPFAKKVVYGTLEDLEIILFQEALAKIDWEKFNDAKVVVKGCSKINVPIQAYVETINRLRPYASSIMFGEPCSTVPLFKKSKAN